MIVSVLTEMFRLQHPIVLAPRGASRCCIWRQPFPPLTDWAWSHGDPDWLRTLLSCVKEPPDPGVSD